MVHADITFCALQDSLSFLNYKVGYVLACQITVEIKVEIKSLIVEYENRIMKLESTVSMLQEHVTQLT